MRSGSDSRRRLGVACVHGHAPAATVSLGGSRRDRCQMQRLEAATEEETNALEELLHRTMPDAQVLSVQRNQHDRHNK